jgi:carboxypeptidase C (cathepsin A)
VPTRNPDPYPPPLDNYLNNTAVTSEIGSYSTWQNVSLDVYYNFAATGDWMRTSRPDLEKVINAGVRTVVYDGDADYLMNFKSVEAMVRPCLSCALHIALHADNSRLRVRQVASLNTKFSKEFAQQEFAKFTVHGVSAGLYKNAGTFSYLRVYGAGHEVPAYMWTGVPRGAAALQMFTQIMSGHQLSGT